MELSQQVGTINGKGGLEQVVNKPHRLTFRMSPEEALSVVRGDIIFYAEHIGIGGLGDICLGFYYTNGSSGVGFLKNFELYDGFTYDTVRRLTSGSHLLVRKVGRAGRNGATLFFKPVVNFWENDKALSPTGENLVTYVDRAEKHGIIHNLPIIFVREGRGSILNGVGYVLESGSPTRMALIQGAENDVGKYTCEAQIVKNKNGSYLAEKIR